MIRSDEDREALTGYVDWLASEVRQGRCELFTELYEYSRRFVHKRARDFVRINRLPDAAEEDLAQEGFLGLLKSIDDYDVSRGPFLHWANYSIRRMMGYWVLRFQFSVALPSHLNQLGRYREVRRALVRGLRRGMIELDAPEHRSDPSRGYLGRHFIVDDSDDPGDFSFRRDLFDHLFAMLSAEEQQVIHLRMDGLSLEAVAEQLRVTRGRKGESRKRKGLSRQRIDQIQKRAMQKMIVALRRWDLSSQVRIDGYHGTGTSGATRNSSRGPGKTVQFAPKKGPR